MATVGKLHIKRGGGIAKIASLLPGPNAVKAGFIAGEADQHNIQKAIWNEFGTRGGASGGGWGGPVPERPAVRNALRNGSGANKDGLAKAGKEVLKAAAKGGGVAGAKRAALAKLGAKVQGDIQQEITSLATPPNSPITVKLKGSSNPLIDTGEMRASVSWKIDE